jgi:hypothetical protein
VWGEYCVDTLFIPACFTVDDIGHWFFFFFFEGFAIILKENL